MRIRPLFEAQDRKEFERELSELLNVFCVDSALEAPDFIIAGFITDTLELVSRRKQESIAWKGGNQ